MPYLVLLLIAFAAHATGLVVAIDPAPAAVPALQTSPQVRVHALHRDADDLARTRQAIGERNGPICADLLAGNQLPYIDNIVNRLIADELGDIPMAEVQRVLAPRGQAIIAGKTISKPIPDGADEWTHYLYNPSNNAVAQDSLVGPPRRLQWVGGPRFSRHHDKMSSVNAVVSADGRVYYIIDEASRVSALLPPDWQLVARDAYNGVVLWKQPITVWQPHLWGLKNGPAQLPRRLVATGNRVYVTLAINGPVQALDGASGEILHRFEGSAGADEILVLGDTILTLIGLDADKPSRGAAWRNMPQTIIAYAPDGSEKWRVSYPVLPNTLAADRSRAVFHDGDSVVALNLDTGREAWRSRSVARAAEIKAFFAPTLVLYKDTVLFAGGERAGVQRGWDRTADSMTALDLVSGKELWTAEHPASGYRSAEDILVVDGLVWTGETTSGRAEGTFTGRDPRSGEIKKQFDPDVDTYWFHHRCHRAKATENFLLTSRTGVEFLDVKKQSWDTNHWVRGACLYGIMPANGLLYAPQHPCACYLEAKLTGFNALAPDNGPRLPAELPTRLSKGPAYGFAESAADSDDAWPTFRHDNARSGRASTTVGSTLSEAWRVDLGGTLTAPVVADAKLIVADKDAHTLYAFQAESGTELWTFIAGGRIDSPPTIYGGYVYFGSADGYLYSLRSADGALAWKFRAAPIDQRLISFGQLESAWPVHGAVLIRDDVLYAVAGRSMFLDAGLRLWRLNPLTGAVLSETVLDEKEESTGKQVQDYVSWLNMPVGLPDVLSADSAYIYMRSQPFKPDGTRLPLVAMERGKDADAGAPVPKQAIEHSHVFSPSGFLDDSWWHRSYWLFGSMYVGGWQGYYRAGKTAPSGRLIVFDDKDVYAFGRKPEYFRWTTPIEHQLFASPRGGSAEIPKDPKTQIPKGAAPIVLAKSATRDPSKRALTVEVRVKAEQATGGIVAQGGIANGYAIHLKNGIPVWAVRSGGALTEVSGKQRILKRWAALKGVLHADGKMEFFVDGKLAGVAKSALLTANPIEGLSIGVDAETGVGDYADDHSFGGHIDTVAIAFADSARFEKKVDTVFLGGSAATTRRSAKRPADYKVPQRWTRDLPLLVRGMVLVGDTLFVAGPEDLINEDTAQRSLKQPETQAKIREQAAAIAGERGAILRAVSTKDGSTIANSALPVPPVFDGLVAAYGRLYSVGQDGSIICLDD
jgi:outer membrane protein assembly factor BamB